MPLKLIETRRTSQEELQRVKMDQVDFDWLAEHTEEIGEKYKGKYMAVVNKPSRLS